MAFLDETGLAELWNLIKAEDDGLVNEYVWEKTKQKIVLGEAVTKLRVSLGYDNVQCSDTCAVVGGEVVLSGNVQTVLVEYGGNYSALSGKYFITTNAATSAHNNVVMYANGSLYEDNSSPGHVFINANVCKGEVTSYGFVNSPNADAYPISDGYVYTALGKFGDAFGGARIETMSYTGTGSTGKANCNSLQIPDDTKIIVVSSGDVNHGGHLLIANPSKLTSNTNYVWSNIGGAIINGSVRNMNASFSNGFVYWYNDSGSGSVQMNASNIMYNVILVCG